MKKIAIVILVLMTLSLSASFVIAEEKNDNDKRVIEISYEFGLTSLQENFFSTINMKAAYDSSMFGLGTVLDDSSLGRRLGKIGIAWLLKKEFSFIAHEDGHVIAETMNRGGSCSPHYFFWQGANAWYCKDGVGFENRNDTSGLASDYGWTDRILRKRLGKQIEIQDYVSFIDSQSYQSWYISNTPSNPDDDIEADIASWIRHQSLYHPIQEKLLTDLHYSAVWQALGLILPLYKGVEYIIWGGEKTRMPKMWLNPVGELTDAGVIYRLDGYLLTDDGTFFKASTGIGWDRAHGDTLISLAEAEVVKPLYDNDWKLTLIAGISKTLMTNYNLGLGLEKKIPWLKDVSVSVSIDYYSGYHIENLKQKGTHTDHPVSDSNTKFSIGMKYEF